MRKTRNKLLTGYQLKVIIWENVFGRLEIMSQIPWCRYKVGFVWKFMEKWIPAQCGSSPAQMHLENCNIQFYMWVTKWLVIQCASNRPLSAFLCWNGWESSSLSLSHTYTNTPYRTKNLFTLTHTLSHTHTNAITNTPTPTKNSFTSPQVYCSKKLHYYHKEVKKLNCIR